MFWMDDVNPSIFITLSAFALAAAWAAATARAVLVAIIDEDDDDDFELPRDFSFDELELELDLEEDFIVPPELPLGSEPEELDFCIGVLEDGALLDDLEGKFPLKLCELCNFFETGPLETPGLSPDLELLFELDGGLLLLPLFEPFLFWIVSLIPSELGLTIYSELFPCVEAAVVDNVAAVDADEDEPERSVEAHKRDITFSLGLVDLKYIAMFVYCFVGDMSRRLVN